jgi:arginase
MQVIGVPFDECGKRSGSRLGPEAVRLAGLHETMESIGIPIPFDKDICIESSENLLDGLKNFVPALSCVRSLKETVVASLKTGDTPLVIGGDHFTVVGSIAGALEVYGSDLAVIWIDAHADLNTPGSSPSGNLHGMPFAALLGAESGVTGLQDTQWRTLVCDLIKVHLRPDHSAWFGLRELDAGEQGRLRTLPGRFVSTMHDIDRRGILTCLEEFDTWLRATGVKHLWISFDVDVLDPLLAPGTGTAVRGGLSYREMHVFGEVLHEMLSDPACPYKLVGLDLVEINPLTDTNNVTALTAVEWIASLFGKRILGPRD